MQCKKILFLKIKPQNAINWQKSLFKYWFRSKSYANSVHKKEENHWKEIITKELSKEKVILCITLQMSRTKKKMNYIQEKWYPFHLYIKFKGNFSTITK